MTDDQKDDKKMQQSNAFKQALDALETMGDVNLVLAPSKPTPEMSVKASQATGLSLDIVNEIYDIMIKEGQKL